MQTIELIPLRFRLSFFVWRKTSRYGAALQGPETLFLVGRAEVEAVVRRSALVALVFLAIVDEVILAGKGYCGLRLDTQRAFSKTDLLLWSIFWI